MALAAARQRRPEAAPPGGEPTQRRPVVLVLRALGLGDAVTGIPALRGLRRAFPDAWVVLAAPSAVGEWLCRLGAADDVVPADERLDGVPSLAERPDIAVNLHGKGPLSHRWLAQVGADRVIAHACPEEGHWQGPAWRSDLHEVDRWCDLVRWAGGPCGREDLRLLAHRTAGGRLAVVHPGASAGARRWPAERWAAVASALVQRGIPTVVTGSAAETELCASVAHAAAGVVNLAGRLDLDALALLTRQARLVLSGDTGIAHLATAYATPSVTLFGPTPPQQWGPAIDPDLHLVLWHPEASDAPGDPHAATIDPRLAAVSVAELLGAADAQLARG